jgi:hypothetical protein
MRNPMRTTCCPCGCGQEHSTSGLSRRGFLQGVSGAGALGMALTGLTWSAVATAAQTGGQGETQRRALVVRPVLVYDIPRRRPQTSWRSWGGIQTQQDADQELARIEKELSELKKRADFPVEFAKPIGIEDLENADATIVYAAGGNAFEALAKRSKNMIVFCRHKSGPVYLWYEIISPRYLRQHTDALKVQGLDDGDVIVDNQDEILWRLRALCGLQNTLGTKILCIGGPGAWAQPAGVVPDLVRKVWKFDMQTVSYEELGGLIKQARADSAAVSRTKERAAKYLKAPRVKLETKPEFVENAFLLEEVFLGLMKKADCRAITINGCMGTIMPLAETSACLTLSLLNDAGYLAFCESDFVVIPSGVLLANISGKPMFLNDPTYPHDGVITLAHCTGPRRMNGEDLEPVRILTHFESDYGAAPKVEMRKGQTTTNIIPDFLIKRWVGIKGPIVDVPFMDICRCQIDISFKCDSKLLAEKMPGFHWMTCYGDYMQEIGYACKKLGIQWEDLTA